MAWSNPSGKDNPEWLAEELPAPAATFPPGSEERMLYVVAFAVSGYSSTAGRTSKPFNPLLGETYEIVHPEKGLRAIVEKVVHHPMLTPVGLLTLTFKDGDEYTWHKVVSSINNLIIAKVHMDHGGTMRIHSSASGLVCKLKYREQGVLRMREKLEKPLVFDKWDEAMYAEMPGNTQRLLWQKSEPPPDPTRYNLTNTVTPGLEKKLAPTDCRLRPDQHHLELGQYDQANAEKLRLETTQRAARKAAEQGAPIKLRWFARVEGAEPGRQQAYVYHGGNFEAVAIVKQKLSTTISELVAEELKVVSFKCVQPTQPKDASELWNSDNVQTLEFFTSLVKGGSDNCLADKCWSAVQCQQAKHDPSLSTTKALRARKSADAAPAAAAPGNGGVVAAIKKAIAGGGVKKGAAMSAMWSKAPPKEAKDSAPAAQPAVAEKAAHANAECATERAEAKQESTAAVDGEAALRRNDQAESSSNSEEEHSPIQRSNPESARAPRRCRGLRLRHARASEQASKRSRSGNAAARKHTTVLNESDDDSHREAPKKNSGKTLKEGGLEWFTAAAPRRDDEEGPSQKKKATTKASAAKRQSLGTIKDHGEATGGPKRRKVLRATYNDKESSE
ncbi:hypothetical protein WJX75_004375 [Coccomyxa subellipsoidea]|uniref:Uncharacterized protein n=1 Tax=Coccomyxa subellipsoidea TaxID=248742 RepID=A0ABR2YVL4_9CHLO